MTEIPSRDIVELVVTGQVGLNLQATRVSTGAFVNSFYRGVDIDGSEVILPAESNLGANFLGAIISSVNNQDVTGSHAITVCDIISKADRPMTLKFFVNSQIIENPLELSNFAGLPWLLEHLEDLSLNAATNAATSNEDYELLKSKLLLYTDCERVLLNTRILKSTQQGKLCLFVNSLRSLLHNVDAEKPKKYDVFVAQISDILRRTIIETLVPSFNGSLAMRRMKGYLYNFPTYGKLAFVDILENTSLLAHFFIFLSRSGKRHVLLLCYMQMKISSMATDLFRNLIICSAALKLCKEQFLEKAKGDLDQLINTLQSRSTVEDKKNSKVGSILSSIYLEATHILENIVDCLAWEYAITIYPAFENSKDYSTLHSSIDANITLSAETNPEIRRRHHSKDGSLNELLRTKRIPSSLTVHRRVRTQSDVAPSKHQNPTTIKILLFDSCVDEPNSDRQSNLPKLIGADSTEDECMRAQVQVRGKIEVIGYRTLLSDEQHVISRESKSTDSLRALSTFFVPTGKHVALETNSSHQIMDEKQSPPAKLYSMVLNARDQTPLYACSLVLYRSFHLLNPTRTRCMSGMHHLQPDQRSKEVIREEINIKDTPISFSTPLVAANQINIVKDPCPVKPKIKSAPVTVVYGAPSLNIVDVTLKLGALEIDLTAPSNAYRVDDWKVQQEAKVVAPDTLHDPTILIEHSANILKSANLITVAPEELLHFASGTFSDDESAGIKSSIKSSSDELLSTRIMQETADTKAIVENTKPSHGTFAEFLSATANATASVASAFALQAGSLPASSFAWSANIQSNTKANEVKGFYDNLSFSRFKAKHFSYISQEDHKYTEIGSNLKRKYDENTINSPVAKQLTNSLSSHTSLTTLTNQSDTCSNSPQINQSAFESDSRGQSWAFSPEKYTLSSYPKFGKDRPSKQNLASPRIPRSPSRKHIPLNHGRKSRSNVLLASRQGPTQPAKKRIPESKDSSKFDFLISNGSSITAEDSKCLPDVGTVIIQDNQQRSATSAKQCQRSLGRPLSEGLQILPEGTNSLIHASYGFTLISELPVIEYLRKAAYSVLPEFKEKYTQIMNSNGTLPPPSCDFEELSQLIKERLIDTPHEEIITDRSNTTKKSTADGRIDDTGRDNGADLNSIIVFDALSPKNVVTVLIAFLLEYRIVAVSSRALSASTHLGEWLKNVIYPLKYAHVYSPLVPPSIGLQLIHCPAPFFIGMRRSSKIDEIVELEDERDREKNEGRRGKPALPRDSNCGLLLVDLDRDECSMPHDLCSLVRSARVLIRALESLLYPHLYNCDEVDAGVKKEECRPAKLAHDATKLCMRFVSSLLEGSKQSCLSAEDGDEVVVLFDEILFIQQHCIQILLNPAIIVTTFRSEERHQDCRDTARDIGDSHASNVESAPYFESMLPSTINGSKDVQNLLRYLMRTQSFSSYLTS